MTVGLITAVVAGLDAHMPVPDPVADADGESLSRLLGLLHVPVLALVVWVIGQNLHSVPANIGLIIAAGLYFGQISNANAHELIHRPGRWSRGLGVLCYASLLYGHHASAHRLVHHVHAATPLDPNSARAGEGFWRFLLRAWPGEFSAGLRAESLRRVTRKRGLHPYLIYAGLSAVTLGGAWMLGDQPGLVAYLMIAVYAQIQHFLSDYVQHYGLRRTHQPDGRYAPMGPEHSWNAPHVASAAMMLNAPRHSDHHLRPACPYPALRLDAEAMPTLPYSLPFMATLALIPPIWRRVMTPRLAGQTAQPSPQRHQAGAPRSPFRSQRGMIARGFDRKGV